MHYFKHVQVCTQIKRYLLKLLQIQSLHIPAAPTGQGLLSKVKQVSVPCLPAVCGETNTNDCKTMLKDIRTRVGSV